MLDRLLTRWRGVVLTLVIVAAVGVLAATGQLGAYIHPRYFVFTIVLCAVAAAGCLLAVLLPATDHDHDDHGHDHDHRPPGRTRAIARVAIGVSSVAAAVVLLVLPARSLSPELAAARSDAAAVSAARPVDLSALSGADYGSFGLKDWSGLLAQGASAAFLAGKTATLQGFVLPDDRGGADVFLLTRLTITCCAVDAQPVSVPVRVVGWASRFAQGDWVSLTGGFITNPDAASPETVVLSPTDIGPIAEPADPYAY